MLKIIIEKEIREMTGSAKFAIAFAVCAALILLSFYAGAKNHQLSMARYEAAKAENLRKMEGMTDWFNFRNHRIFLPPNPITNLVAGISNDIGKTIEVEGRGELNAQGSRFNEEPIFAIFRFLDLEFLFLVILSLFAILLGYDAISGEKERGTLRLAFANSVPRDRYILGKLIGIFTALSIPLLLAMAIGCLLLPLMGINLSGADWTRLVLIILSGLLYFGAFLALSVFVSALTQRTSSSFLILLVVWIMAVLIVPRASVLLAARSVEVPSVDKISAQKAIFSSQLWQEDKEKMSSFRPEKSDDPEAMVNQFNRFMDDLANKREEKMNEYAERLNEERSNKLVQQEKLAFTLARISPSASLSIATSHLAGTSLELKEHFKEEAENYQKAYASFIKEKTGMNTGGRVMMFKVKNEDGEEPESIDPTELPQFNYNEITLASSVGYAVKDMGILAIFNMIFFMGAFLAFRKYDLR
jgi:ABC-type transport system involved in multi-copper enzyme maturation permease subunit